MRSSSYSRYNALQLEDIPLDHLGSLSDPWDGTESLLHGSPFTQITLDELESRSETHDNARHGESGNYASASISARDSFDYRNGLPSSGTELLDIPQASDVGQPFGHRFRNASSPNRSTNRQIEEADYGQFTIPRKPVGGTSHKELEALQQTPCLTDAGKPCKHMFFHVSYPLSQWWARRHILRIWWLESICCFFAIGSLVALVGTIRAYEGKPLPQWPYGLSINAIIAAYTVVMKASAGLILAEGISHLKCTNLARPRPLRNFVVHDNASRGPWGAVQLLWNEKGSNVSSLGAIITILILFLDPFSQQVLRFYDCSQIITKLIATVPRTNSYIEEGKHLAAILSTVPQGVRNAVNNGLFAVNKPQLPFICPTGNCTFHQDYRSLAFCTSCEDKTSSLIRTDFEQYNGNSTEKCINITLPDQSKWSEPYNMTLTRCPRTYGVPSFIASATGDSFHTDGMTMIRWNPERNNPAGSPTWSSYSCSLYPCVRTYTAQIVAGRLHEDVVEESEKVIFRKEVFMDCGPFLSGADLQCLDMPEQRQLLRNLGYTFNDTTRWLTVHAANPSDCAKNANMSIELARIGNIQTESWEREPLFTVPARCIYSFAWIPIRSLELNLYPYMFDGQLNDSWNYGYPAFAGPEPLMAIWHAGSGNGTFEDFSGVFRNISDALTNHVRENGWKDHSKPVTGQVHYYTTCVRVRWLWLAYSAATVVLLVLFFAGMILRGRIDQSRLRRTWKSGDTIPSTLDFKSSSLPLVFHSLEPQSHSGMASPAMLGKEKELEDKAKEMMVQLIATDRGWKLSIINNTE